MLLSITLPPSSFSSQQLLNILLLTNQAKKQGVQHVPFTSSTSVFPDISGGNLMKVLNSQLKQKWVKH